MSKKCTICGIETETGVYNVKHNHVCRNCLNTFTNLHVDDFKIQDRKVIQTSPYEGQTQDEQRSACIEFVYTLFDQKVAPRTFSMLKNYIKKGYTWIGITRAVEWFYLVKRNDISKAKGSLGIVPYVYDEAQIYYEKLNKQLLRRFEEQILPKEEESERIIIKRKNV